CQAPARRRLLRVFRLARVLCHVLCCAGLSGRRWPRFFQTRWGISAFGQQFARTGRVPIELHRYLLEAMAVRHQGDYALRPGISASDAAEQITRAEQFLAAAERLIGPVLPPDGDTGHAPEEA